MVLLVEGVLNYRIVKYKIEFKEREIEKILKCLRIDCCLNGVLVNVFY